MICKEFVHKTDTPLPLENHAFVRFMHYEQVYCNHYYSHANSLLRVTSYMCQGLETHGGLSSWRSKILIGFPPYLLGIINWLIAAADILLSLGVTVR